VTFAILGATVSVPRALERTERFRLRSSPLFRAFFTTDLIYS